MLRLSQHLTDALQASKTWDEHVRASGLPENRETAITLMSVVPDWLVFVLICLFIRTISRQFIARYVHDLIVKHNVRDLPTAILIKVLTYIFRVAPAVMGHAR
jgi:hypothetical protein